MNGFGLLVLAFVFVAGTYVIPRIMALDVVLRDMEDLDDEQLAVLNEYPDVLVRVAKW
jgi:hypothetical protein